MTGFRSQAHLGVSSQTWPGLRSRPFSIPLGGARDFPPLSSFARSTLPAQCAGQERLSALLPRQDTTAMTRNVPPVGTSAGLRPCPFLLPRFLFQG